MRATLKGGPSLKEKRERSRKFSSRKMTPRRSGERGKEGKRKALKPGKEKGEIIR